MNLALARLLRRAEDEDPERLAESFVEVGAIFARLSTLDNQIILGRRGTGKTHALAYLAKRLRSQGDIVVSIDLRQVGSNGGIYNDRSTPISEAATRLLLDVLERVHEDLMEQVLERVDQDEGITGETMSLLDRLADAISEVSVIGDAEQRDTEGLEVEAGSDLKLRAGISPAGPALRFLAEASDHRRAVREREVLLRGVAQHRVHFGKLGSVLRKLVPALPGKRLWLLLDEWSTIPLHLQPLLADIFRRGLLPVRGLTLKIAAIDHRSVFKVDQGSFSYLGFEVGADIAADVDLDDFMVFSNDEDMAVGFFAQLFRRHVAAIASEVGGLPPYPNADDFVRDAFASQEAFRELVRAAEGVPRDAINIVGKAALKSEDKRISVQTVQAAARRWYLQDKESTVKANQGGLALLHWIIDRVIGHRKVRGFLLRQGDESPLVHLLYDQRVLHLVKRGIAAKDRPGVRYDAYALDYGCYVDLFGTSDRAPRGLIGTDDDVFLDVPPDEYSDDMRGAILSLGSFEANLHPEQAPRDHLVPDIVVRSTTMSMIEVRDELDDPREQLRDSGWYLLTQQGGQVAAIEIGRRTLKIGSSTESHIRVRNADLLVKHATLSKADPGLVISNPEHAPVYVNGRRNRNTVLADRDTVRIGEVEFVVVHRIAEVGLGGEQRWESSSDAAALETACKETTTGTIGNGH